MPPEAAPARTRPWIVWAGVTAALLLAVGGGTAGWLLHQLALLEGAPTGAAAAPSVFEVRRGESLRSVIERLYNLDRVPSPAVVGRWARRAGLAGCLKAGVHDLDPSASPRELLEALCTSPPAPSLRFTLPEGATLWRVDAMLSQAAGSSEGAILEMGAAEDSALVSSLPSSAHIAPGFFPNRLEGYLAPDTYELPLDDAPGGLLRAASRGSLQILDKLFAAAPRADPPLGRHAAVTLASIVEREAVRRDEMPRIAAVYLNRLRLGMRLQADPTLTYGPRRWRLEPSPSLRRDDSNPYNTYAIEGLPPGPIGAPSEAALRAVLNPAKSRALYFVARGDGSGRHRFARTYEQHRRNVALYRKAKR
jgi:UPF0755 protein